MTDFSNKIKLYLTQCYENVRFQIDIACQTEIDKLRKSGFDCTEAEQRYFFKFICSLRTIEEESMRKLNDFMLREGKNIEKLSQNEILLRSGCQSVVYIENDNLSEYFTDEYKQLVGGYMIGVFVHSPFWLSENSIKFIRLQFSTSFISRHQLQSRITLDKVIFSMIV